MNAPSRPDQGATAVITHRVRAGQQAAYEDWLKEIGPICRGFPGHVDWQIIIPIPGHTTTFTVIIRFDTEAHLQQWMGSPQRTQLIDKVRPLLSHDDDFFIRSGLDFWFVPEGAKARVPVRWKQYLVTWSAIFPLSLGISYMIHEALRWMGMPSYRVIDSLIVSGLVVWCMVYVVMPRYTRAVHHWLFH